MTAAERERLQCKDIPEMPILQFLRDLPDIKGFPGIQRPATWFWSHDYKPDNSVGNAMPTEIPEKLILAKMKALMRRKLVEGCGCGCRGDFTLTEKGRALLAEMEGEGGEK